MKHAKSYTVSAIFALALSSSAAWAQQQDLEVTMDVVPANALPGAVTAQGQIQLPETAASRARDASAFGHTTANRAHELKGELGREFGREVSQRAHEKPRPPVPTKKP